MIAKKVLATMIILVFFQVGIAQSTTEFFSRTDAFLKMHVKNGRVDYEAIKGNLGDLDETLRSAQDISVSKNDSNTYQAFWINAYNLLVIKEVAKNYPVKSPLDISGIFDTTEHKIGGENITLNDIENRLLRGNFSNEARFHFVLVCAGLGCPPIISEAYLPDELEGQLQRQTVLALNNPDFIQVKNDKVLLSQIFDWYKEDFITDGKTAIDFINQFRKEKIDPDKRIGHYSYDWRLNDLN
ncbi:DUF547 domain-containing protein [Allomuricauda sp. SCSIO 65647]|uniref:DUF547 domain-containing protein n=1 Tax=Allomuricauda sp. SCSIO 65647 TaxID=2908843 RepID=UPI001F24B18D|nr:DUF547 domain-containing protein [Muricauda sp. SCSIO 65647]UJH66280.1 DUF547 domain-containing protein [Muricauda sp. SCSIO 65647]